MNISIYPKTDNYICEITKSEIVVEEVGEVTVYGIRLYNKIPEKALLTNEACTIEDISPDFDSVCLLKQMIDELGIEPVHLRDIVEDFLSQV